MNNKTTIATLALPFALVACQHTVPVKSPTVDATFAEHPATPPSAPPTAVTEALIPDFNQTLLAESRPLHPQVFNISVHAADAREFFMGLVVDTQENMVIHPEVVGRISLELKNVTVLQVLDAVQKVYGFDYRKTDIGYIIYPATLQTKIFKIDHIDLLRKGQSSTRVSSGQISQNSGSQYGNMPQQPSALNNPNANNSTSGSFVSTTSETDFWQELQQSLAAVVDVSLSADTGNGSELLNKQTGSKVVINKQTGVVVVRANPSQMREVERLIETTQGQIGRQVIIEAKILEIVLDDQHQDGVNWANIVREGGKAFLTASNPLPSLVSQTADVFTLGLHSGDFYAFISLMESQGKTNILSSPRISTMNNQKAIIKVGQDEYFITDVTAINSPNSSSSIIGGSNNVSSDITLTPFFSGIALDVTPQISDNHNVTLHIHPSITRVETQNKDFSIDGKQSSLPLALNSVRESDSIVHAENGQIIVIGGLMQESSEEKKQGISLLSRIPYLGNLFRENTGTGKKSELVILLKPTIVDSGPDWNAPLQDSRERMQRLERTPTWK